MKRKSEIKLEELESASFWDSARSRRWKSRELTATASQLSEKRARMDPPTLSEMKQTFNVATELMHSNTARALKLLEIILEEVNNQLTQTVDEKLYKFAGDVYWNNAECLRQLWLVSDDITDDQKIRATKHIAQSYEQSAFYYHKCPSRSAWEAKRTSRITAQIICELLEGLASHSRQPEIALDKFLVVQKIYRMFLPYFKNQSLDDILLTFLHSLENHFPILLSTKDQCIYTKLQIIKNSTSSESVDAKVTQLMNTIKSNSSYLSDQREVEPFSSTNSSEDESDAMDLDQEAFTFTSTETPTASTDTNNLNPSKC